MSTERDDLLRATLSAVSLLHGESMVESRLRAHVPTALAGGVEPEDVLGPLGLALRHPDRTPASVQALLDVLALLVAAEAVEEYATEDRTWRLAEHVSVRVSWFDDHWIVYGPVDDGGAPIPTLVEQHRRRLTSIRGGKVTGLAAAMISSPLTHRKWSR